MTRPLSLARRATAAARRAPLALRLAVALWLAFGLAHAAGLRDCVSVVSGTPVPGVPFVAALPLGAFYVLAWLGAVVVAPVLAVAAALAQALLRLAPRR